MEMITKAELAKRWNVSGSTITTHIKKRNIKTGESGKITMNEVVQQEEWIKTGEYTNYNNFIHYLETSYKLRAGTIQQYFSVQCYIKKWIAGDWQISKDAAMSLIKYYVGYEVQSAYNHMRLTVGA